MAVEKLEKALEIYHEKVKGLNSAGIQAASAQVLYEFGELVRNRVSTDEIDEAKKLLKVENVHIELGGSFFERYKSKLLDAALSVATPAMDPGNHRYDFNTKEGQSQFYRDRDYYLYVAQAIILAYYPEVSRYDAFTKLIDKSTTIINKTNMCFLIVRENQKIKDFSFQDQDFDYYRNQLVESGFFTFRTTALGQDQFVTKPLYSFNGDDAFTMTLPFAGVYLKTFADLQTDQSFILNGVIEGGVISYELIQDPFSNLLLKKDQTEMDERVAHLDVLGKKLNPLFPLFKALAEARGIQFKESGTSLEWTLSLQHQSQSHYIESQICLELEKNEWSSPSNFSGSALSLVNRVKEFLSPAKINEYAEILELPQGSRLSTIIDKMTVLSQEHADLKKDLIEFKKLCTQNRTLFRGGLMFAPSLIALLDYLELNNNLYYVKGAKQTTFQMRDSNSPLINNLCMLFTDSPLDFTLLRIFAEAGKDNQEEVFTSLYSMGMEETLQKAALLYASIEKSIKKTSWPEATVSSNRSHAPFSFRRKAIETGPTASEADVLKWPDMKSNVAILKNK